jgi:VanZ family protein
MPYPASSPDPPERETLLRIHLTRPLLLCAALTILLIVTFAQIPGSTKLAQTLQNSGHAPAFCLLALTLIQLIWQSDGVTQHPTLRQYVAVFVACIVAGIVVELVQAATGRYVSGRDVIADAVGALGGLSGHAYWRLRGTPLARQHRTLLLSAISVACLVVAALPATWSFAAYANRNARFPMLAEFETPLDLYFIRTHGSRAELASVSKVPGTSDPRVEVRVHSQFPGKWPGIELEEPTPDWSGYRTLLLDIANPGDAPLELTLRVHDRAHNNLAADRYNRRIFLEPQSSTVYRIALDDLRHAPKSREMDLTQIAGVVLFGPPSLAGQKFIVRRIWLE